MGSEVFLSGETRLIMGNMGYCKFQNTLGDLQECRDSLEDDVSPDEAKARKKLIQLCREIAADSDFIEDNDDSED